MREKSKFVNCVKNVEVQHVIDTPLLGCQQFVNVRPYRIPEAYKEEVEISVKTMLNQDIIRPSMSPYNFPIIVVGLLKKIDASG